MQKTDSLPSVTTVSPRNTRFRPRRSARHKELDLEAPPRTDAAQTPPEAERLTVPFDEARIDADALKVVRRLIRYGYEAYLVGGGVRDLLLGCRPKDFDIATNARPEEVRALFRNSRIIGRRFRLVHVLFGNGKVIEVATFRRNPEGLADPDHELLIRFDNAFGEAHEDAVRRDLTINALFYDVESHEVIDFVGGLRDIRRRVVRTIGDPVVRFREDPVRMVRAIKFAARLDLGIEPDVYDAIVLCREAIAEAARPRLLEELLKVLRCGAARRAIWLMWETGLLHELLPELGTYLDDDGADNSMPRRFWRMLGELDRLTLARGRPLDDVSLLTLLLLEPLREVLDGKRDRALVVLDFAHELFLRLTVPRRMADALCRIMAALPRLQSGKIGRFSRSELYPIALEVVAVDAAANGR